MLHGEGAFSLFFTSFFPLLKRNDDDDGSLDTFSFLPSQTTAPPSGSSFKVANRNAFSFLAFGRGKGGESEIVKCKCD